MPIRRKTTLLVLGGLTGATLATVAGAGAPGPCPAPKPMTFAAQTIIDETRAGGEPMIQTHPDGTLMYGSHAGTTHFFTPEVANPTSLAFGQNYMGQTYFWYSKDNGTTWTFVDRSLPPDNDPMSGFSDPDFAIDKAGNVYLSEINLANVAVSKSTNVAEGFVLQNFFGMTLTDRQWKEADEENVVYMVGNALGGGTFPTDPVGNNGHILLKTKDGGVTWTAAQQDNEGLGDLRVDKRNGTLYQARYAGGELKMAAYRNARADDLTAEEVVIADGVQMLAHWPSFDLDADGNLYITWDESGTGDREAGVWYAYSTDAGKTWSKPAAVSVGPETRIWPWLAVGDTGRVGIAWFQADAELPDNDAETEGTHAWRVHAAQSITGLGCADSTQPGFSVSTATSEPIHHGTVCQSGTTCQAFLTDRRLGDYFAVEIDPSGAFVAAYSDTSKGGSVSLPGFVRQSGGESFFGKPASTGGKPAVKPVTPPKKPTTGRPAGPPLAATGGDYGTAALAVTALAGLAWAVRRRLA